MKRTNAWRSAGAPAAVRRRTARDPAAAPLSFWAISAVVGMRAFTCGGALTPSSSPPPSLDPQLPQDSALLAIRRNKIKDKQYDKIKQLK